MGKIRECNTCFQVKRNRYLEDRGNNDPCSLISRTFKAETNVQIFTLTFAVFN